MSKDMLGSIIRALVGVPPRHHGVILDGVNKLGGDDADAWRTNIARALREPLTPSPDTFITVNRLLHPTYPEWVEEVSHPELECSGPATFYLTNVDPWLHDGQKNGGRVTGQIIYKHLMSTGTLGNHLGLADALEIQKKGIDVFRKIFGSNVVFFWKAVVRDRVGDLRVPYLFGDGDKVVLLWGWFGLDWSGDCPAARLASA